MAAMLLKLITILSLALSVASLPDAHAHLARNGGHHAALAARKAAVVQPQPESLFVKRADNGSEAWPSRKRRRSNNGRCKNGGPPPPPAPAAEASSSSEAVSADFL